MGYRLANQENPSQKRRGKWTAGKRFIAVIAIILAMCGTFPSFALANHAEQAMAAAYYKIVSDIVYHNGIHTDSDLFDSGLAYADLIDFDGNGIPELYIIYSTWESSSYGGFFEEVWTYSNGNVQKVYEEEDSPSGLIGDRAVSLSSAEGKSYLVYTHEYASGRGDYPFKNNFSRQHTFLTLVNNRMVETASLDYFWEEHWETREERITYTIMENGRERQISEREYQSMLRKYGIDTQREIISSSAGYKSFAFDMTNNEEKVFSFLNSLADKMRAKNLGENQWPQLSLRQKNELTSFLFNFAGIGSIDLRHYTDEEVIRYIKDAWFFRTLDDSLMRKLDQIGEPILMEVKSPDGSYEWFFESYSAKAFVEAAQSLFGITLEKKSNGFAYYDNENDYFYLPEYAFGGNPSIIFPRVQGLYALGDGLYYAEFYRYGVDYFEIGRERIDDYRNAYETLTEWEKSIAVMDGSGYALLHKTEESPFGWQLIAIDHTGILPDDKALNTLKQEWKTRNNPDSWAISEVNAAIQANLVPNSLQGWYGIPITRAEFSRLMMSFLTAKTGKTMDELLNERGKTINFQAFEDTSDEVVLAANALGIVNGRGDRIFDPDGLISRQEAAVMLANAAKQIGLKADGPVQKFADEGQIASWAREAVKFVSSAEDRSTGSKVMGGVTNNKFEPTATFTRQQAIITVKRLFYTNG